MCGIVGYLGPKKVKGVLIDGLARLEYRGYDSAGMAVISEDGFIHRDRAVGKVANLRERIESSDWDGHVGIAHTRWATHGVPNETNTHPHANSSETIFVVHNGIIENYQELRKELESKDYTFVSDTDTEVLAHLIDWYTQIVNDFPEAVRQALKQTVGTYGVAVISKDHPGKLVAARKGSPLILGLGKDEYIVASDMSAIAPHTKDVIFLEDGEVVVIDESGYQIGSLDNVASDHEVQTIDFDAKEVTKEGFDHFMLKEIFEEPSALESALNGRIDLTSGTVQMGGFQDLSEALKQTERILIVACGTSYYAGVAGSYWIEEFAEIPVHVELASEFRYKKILVDDKTLIITISQSGETADTIAAIKEAQSKGAKVFGIVNVVGSTIARMADAGAYTHAGPEIGVASTKAFVSQLGVLALLAVGLGRQRRLTLSEGRKLLGELGEVPSEMREVLEDLDAQVQAVSKKYSKCSNMLFVGRHVNFPIAMEGALKLKEISYLHAEGYASGEMKHGPIALIDDKFPTVALVPKDSVYEKNISNLQEIKARGGKILAVATKGDEDITNHADDVIWIPEMSEHWVPFVNTLALHLLAYYAAVDLDLDPDKPRNLAKSVTVE